MNRGDSRDMMAPDGKRSTMFDWDMQLFYVEFEVQGANVINVKFYKPHINETVLFKEGTTSHGNVVFEKCRMNMQLWDPFWDPHLSQMFMEFITPRAVKRRINP